MRVNETGSAAITLDFARSAQRAKDRLGWTVRDLAAKAGVPVMTAHRAVTTGHVQLSTALRIAAALGMVTGDFGGDP